LIILLKFVKDSSDESISINNPVELFGNANLASEAATALSIPPEIATQRPFACAFFTSFLNQNIIFSILFFVIIFYSSISLFCFSCLFHF
jgi:hypothetical protein